MVEMICDRQPYHNEHGYTVDLSYGFTELGTPIMIRSCQQFGPITVLGRGFQCLASSINTAYPAW
jgi:hypothetical protein